MAIRSREAVAFGGADYTAICVCPKYTATEMVRGQLAVVLAGAGFR